jgi:exopolysaccharide production protein ExoZ
MLGFGRSFCCHTLILAPGPCLAGAFRWAAGARLAKPKSQAWSTDPFVALKFRSGYAVPMGARAGEFLPTVQALRAVAAASVVLHHDMAVLIRKAGYPFTFSVIGAAGVDLFFVISGFVMVYTHFDAFTEPGAAASFARRRVIRVAPLYWIVTTATVALLIAVPNIFYSVRLDWANVAFSYFFLLSERPSGDINTVIVVGWTLCFEAYFYFVFALLLNLPRRYFLPTSALIFGVGLLIGTFYNVPPWATVAVRPLALEFYFGGVLAFLFVAGFALPFGIAIPAIVLGAVATVFTDPANDDWRRILVWGVPAALMVAGGASLERFSIRVPKILVALGASSYSLYLTHPFAVSAAADLWSFFHLTERVPAYVPGVILFCTALGVGHGVYLFLEKPMTGWLKRSWG